MQKEMIKNIAELILEINKDNYKQALIDIRNISDYVANLWEEERRMKLLDSGKTKLIKRVTYNECLELFEDFNLARFTATDFEDFEIALYEEWTDKTEDDDGEMNCETEIYWNYCYADDFEDIIKQHLEETKDGLCTLVMLPNGYLQEIPFEYAYKLGGKE